MKAKLTNISEQRLRELAAGVLRQAERDLRRFRDAQSRIGRELYADAYSWVMSDDCSWLLSFPHVCRLLNRSPEQLRQELAGNLFSSRFRQWIHRGTRALGRFSDSLTRRFTAEDDLTAPSPTAMVETWY
jgi:hypothetical protein